MAVTDHRPPATGAPPVDPAPTAEGRGFRPRSRRRARIAAGVALAAVALGGNVLLYTSLDDSVEVVQVVRTIPAGAVITSDDLRIVDADVDDTVPVVTAEQIELVIGAYARTAIGSGSLLYPGLYQPTPLVAAGSGVVAVEIRASRVPSGVVERSRVMLVVIPEAGGEPFTPVGRVVARGTTESNGSGYALSVEVAEADAPRVAAGDDIRVILLDPATDPALGQGG